MRDKIAGIKKAVTTKGLWEFSPDEIVNIIFTLLCYIEKMEDAKCVK